MCHWMEDATCSVCNEARTRQGRDRKFLREPNQETEKMERLATARKASSIFVNQYLDAPQRNVNDEKFRDRHPTAQIALITANRRITATFGVLFGEALGAS